VTAPTILDTRRAILATTGKDPFTPRWEGTWRAFYGLPLRDVDLENLTAATRRTEAGLRAREQRRGAMRELWCRVGRRGRKSVQAAMVGVHEAAFGGHERFLLPGERGLVAVISKDSAGSQLVANFAELHAAALGFETSWTSIGSVRVLELAGVPFGIAVFACNARAPRGYAIPVVIADEIAHWATDSDEYQNADSAVLAAVKPAMAQFPDSKLIAISSPLGETGLHFETVEANLGDAADPHVLAVEGPTWEWNPEISEARTHEIEKDPETHAREFGAKPSGNEGTAFVPADVAGCFEPHPGLYHWGQPFMVLDPAETVNTFSWCIAEWGEPSRAKRPVMVSVGEGINRIEEAYPARDELGNQLFHPVPERRLLRISSVGGWTGEELRATTMDRVAADLAAIAKNAGADTALSDRRGDVYLAALLSAHRLRLRSFTITNSSKHESVLLLRAFMRDRQISIVEYDGMREDLRTYPRRIAGGLFKYGEARSGQRKHWDHASLLVTLAHGLLEERGTATREESFRVEGAPTKRTIGGRHMVVGR
jgi:hypothetical protein